MSEHSHRIGVLLAAGRASRMGRPKQLLPWPSAANGPETVVSAAFDVIAPLCEDMIVVIGHEAARVIEALGERPFHHVETDPDGQMFESIKRGLRRAQQINPQAPVIMHPADHPAVRDETIAFLVTASEHSSQRAVMPEYGGRGGHPAIIPPNVISRVLDDDGADGLRGLWQRAPELARRIACNDPGTITDLDTLAEYQQAARD